MDARFAERALEGCLPPHGSREVQMAGSLAECTRSLGSGEQGKSVTFISSGQTLSSPWQPHPGRLTLRAGRLCAPDQRRWWELHPGNGGGFE